MAADSRQIDLWRTVLPLAGAIVLASIPLFVTGATLHKDNLEYYGLCLLIGGLVLAGCVVILALRQQQEWRRPPSLPWGSSCGHYPMGIDPEKSPKFPHYQEIVLGFRRRSIYPPDFRITCSAPIRWIEASIIEIPKDMNTAPVYRDVTRYNSTIDAISITFPPLRPIGPRSSITVIVFSDEPIRVKRIKRLRTKYEPVPPSADPPAATTSA